MPPGHSALRRFRLKMGQSMPIGFLGGTGIEGKGLALRFARAGVSVIIGSRSAEREPMMTETPARANRRASPFPSIPVPPKNPICIDCPIFKLNRRSAE